ncbi:MAG: UDP-galactopyranose mutase [Clostridiales Family XIII bacterium]|jgi:UDP-galactopyranose mutase|nr:UDP-galactopyranose mutase [Clostridiales Family XIII bacterium]
MYDYLIVGAGWFGAVFAHEAMRNGAKCLVIDRRPHIGGNSYTEEIDGIQTHRYGPHIFHTDDRGIWEYVGRFAEFNRFTNAPIANYRGQIYNLPFNMNTFYQLWGVSRPEEARRALEGRREAAGGQPASLEAQAISLIGREAYEKLVKGYTEKQWGRPCHQLPASIIKRLPVRFTFDNSYFSDRFQGIPIGGYTRIFGQLLDGAELRLGEDCFKELKGSGIAGKIVYTGMIDEYFEYRFGALEYRSLRFEPEVLDMDDFQGNAVVNYTAAEIPYTRIIEHKHFEPGAWRSGKTVITREYPMEWVPGAEPYYPINDGANTERYKLYEALAAETPGVIFGGRLGRYSYWDMWQAIAGALEAAAQEGLR